ncbi:MAG: hypothetical protein K2L37_00340 [Lactobacillus sp.]|nr:hypothetical protein [Duncaniella sp.]MDE6491586.1 hypothetical protein [Lactobacillus sp.]
MELQKYIGSIKKLDELYRESPTAQVLASNAPMVLSIFREMRQDMADRCREIDRICIERSYDLKKFSIVADKLTNELSLIGQEIRNLQKTVRDKAAILGTDPGAQIQINYTNKQISDLINIFNTLTIRLLTA